MSSAIPASRYRVEQNTAADVNRQFQEEMRSRLAYFSRYPERIDARLAELDREWDIERAIEANAASLALFGLSLSVTVSRKWLLLPTVVAGFLLTHSLQGWCPPVPLFRRMGFRTAREIEDERNRLLDLRSQTLRTVEGENL